MSDEDRVVWKIALDVAEPIFEKQLPVFAVPLCVTMVRGVPVAYFLARPDNPSYARRFQIALTGRPLVDPNADWKYVGTWVKPGLFGESLVGHLFLDDRLGEPGGPPAP